MIDTADYVLGNFSKSDLRKIEDFFPKSVDILKAFIVTDFEKVMSKYN